MVHEQMNEPRGVSCGLLATRVLGLSPTLGPFSPVLHLSPKARGHTHIIGVGVLLCDSVCMCLKWRKKKEKNWTNGFKNEETTLMLCSTPQVTGNLRQSDPPNHFSSTDRKHVEVSKSAAHVS